MTIYTFGNNITVLKYTASRMSKRKFIGFVFRTLRLMLLREYIFRNKLYLEEALFRSDRYIQKHKLQNKCSSE